MNSNRKRFVIASIVGAIVLVVCVGLFEQNGVWKKEEQTSQHSTQKVTIKKSSLETITNPTTTNQQPTFNGQPITTNDWHSIGPFYYVKGTISKMQAQTTPSDKKEVVWNDVYLKIDQYVHSTEPQTQDGNMKVGRDSLFFFYNYVDKGQDHLRLGDQVVMKVAEYTTPAGKIVWGCKYDDIYYKKAGGFVNNEGTVIPQ